MSSVEGSSVFTPPEARGALVRLYEGALQRASAMGDAEGQRSLMRTLSFALRAEGATDEEQQRADELEACSLRIEEAIGRVSAGSLFSGLGGAGATGAQLKPIPGAAARGGGPGRVRQPPRPVDRSREGAAAMRGLRLSGPTIPMPAPLP